MTDHDDRLAPSTAGKTAHSVTTGSSLSMETPEMAGGRRWTRKPCLWLGLALFLVALCLRLVYVADYGASVGIDYYLFEQTDNNTFHEWALNIAGGDWLCENQVHPHHKWTAEVAPERQWTEWYGGRRVYHQAPLYPYLLGVVYYVLGPHPEAIRYLQAVMGAFTVLLVFLTARHYFGRAPAAAAAFLLSFAGFHFYYDAFLLRENLIAFLTMLFLYLASLAFRKERALWLVPAGLALGLGMVAKPNAILLAPLYVAALWWIRRKTSLMSRLGRTLLFGVAVLLPVAPFAARNASLGIPPLKMSTRGPTAFINGNLRGQTGIEWNPPAEKTRNILWESNYTLNRVIRETLRTYLDKPWAWVQKQCEKTQAFLSSYEIPNNTNYYLIRSVSRTLSLGFVSYWFMASAALLGMVLLLPAAGRVWQLYGVVLTLTAVTVLFFIVARFRQPMIPLFAIFAGYACVWTFRKIRDLRLVAVLPALGLFAAILSWTSHDALTYENDRSAFTGAMLKLAAQGDFARAEEFKNRLMDHYRRQDTRYSPILEGKLARIDEAFEAFFRASFYRRDEAPRWLHQARGYQCLLDLTKRTQFLEFTEYTLKAAERALTLDPDLPGAHRIQGECLAERVIRKVGGRADLSDLRRAYIHFHEELKRNPDDLETIKALGSCARLFGGHAEAAGYFATYLERSESWDPEVAHQLVKSRFALAQTPGLEKEKALEMMRDVVALAEETAKSAPRDVNILSTWSDTLYVVGRIQEAIEVLEGMIRIDRANRKRYVQRIESFRKVADKPRKDADDTGGDE